MTLDDLKRHRLIYLGTPYTLYPNGIDAAFIEAAQISAELLRRKISAYSPIVYGHAIAHHGEIDPLDHGIWLPFNQAMMDKSDCLLVATMLSWEKSKGLRHEIDDFAKSSRPVFYINPRTLDVTVAP